MDIKGVRHIKLVTSPPPPYGYEGSDHTQHLELRFAEGQVVKIPLEYLSACDVLRAETAADREKK
jgi:hypothetical protein